MTWVMTPERSQCPALTPLLAGSGCSQCRRRRGAAVCGHCGGAATSLLLRHVNMVEPFVRCAGYLAVLSSRDRLRCAACSWAGGGVWGSLVVSRGDAGALLWQGLGECPGVVLLLRQEGARR